LVWTRILEELEVGVHADEDLVEGGELARSLRMVPLRLEDRQPDPGLRPLSQLGDERVFRTEVVRRQVIAERGVQGASLASIGGRAGVSRGLVVPCIASYRLTIMCDMVVNGGRRTQLLRGVLDLCLLAVMDEGPAYGYEMTKRLGERRLSIVGEGSIYPLLGRLERDGLVDTHRAASNGGPPRKYYQLSRQGQRALASGIDEWQTTREAVDAVLGLAKAEVRS